MRAELFAGVLVLATGGASCAVDDAPAGLTDAGASQEGAAVDAGMDAPGSSEVAPAFAPDVAAPRDTTRDRARREIPDGFDGDALAAGCTAGHVCRGSVRCQRACTGTHVSRCACTEGHFVCTGCMAVDAGADDGRPFDRCGPGIGTGRRCERGGTICQLALDASAVRLCVCGDDGGDRVWICQ